jgi:polar amino acid transport system substrate-binding protein
MKLHLLRGVVFSSLLALTSGASASGAPPHLFLTAELAPPDIIGLADGRANGISTDKIREMMARAGIGYDIAILPWKRAYLQAQQRSDTCVYSTTRTPERESLFKWVGPTRELDWTLFGRADHTFKLTTLEDARALRIGVYNGDVRADYLAARGFKIDSVQNDDVNPRKLMLNRIDLWATSEQLARALVAQHGLTGQVVPLLVFNQVRLYLACNPGVPDQLISAMNAAMDKMNRDGTAKAIEQKYDQWKP